MSHLLSDSLFFFFLSAVIFKAFSSTPCPFFFFPSPHHRPSSFFLLVPFGGELVTKMPQETLTFPPLYCLVGAYRLVHDPTLWRPMWAKCSRAAKHASIVGFTWALLTWPFQKLFVYYFMSASASVTGLGGIYSKVVQTADVTDDNLPFRIPVPSLQSMEISPPLYHPCVGLLFDFETKLLIRVVVLGLKLTFVFFCFFVLLSGGAAFATVLFVIGQVHAIGEFWLRRMLKECRSTAYVQTVRSRGKAADWWTEYVEEFSNPPTEKAIKHAKKQGWYLKLASPLVRFLILKGTLSFPLSFSSPFSERVD